jgi:hypothetical protein
MLEYIYNFFKYFILERTDIKSIDLFFDQFEDETNATFQSTKFPKILIEIPEFNLSNDIGAEYQQGEIEIRLRIYTMNMEGTNSITKQNFTSFAIIDDIYKQLSKIDQFELAEEYQTIYYGLGKLTRSSMQFATNHGNIKEHIMTFKGLIYDNSLYEDKVYIDIDNIITDSQYE